MHQRIGSFRRDRHGDRADIAIAPLRDRACPSWLSPIAQKYWPQILELLEAAGYMADQHRPALALLCDAIADHIELSDQYRKAKPAKRVKLYIQKVKAMEVVKTMLREFGMTPASVASMRVRGQTKKEEDPKARFFNGSGPVPTGPRLAAG